MQINNNYLYIEINKSEFVFFVISYDEKNVSSITHKNIVSNEGVKDKKIVDFELIHRIIKQNILSIERKLNFIFKEVILIIDNFDCSIINFTGYKKLSGSQLAKENITYILNSLKSKINEIENEKIILHIFNSKYLLDKKKIDNLPIGLFGNFYSHELSFFMINKNDYNNLQNIFEKCNLRVKKVLSKSYIEGVTLNNQLKLDTFIKINIDENNVKLFLFENSTLKFFQEFDFGTDVIIKDISKITSLEKFNIKTILENLNFSEKNLEKEFIEKKFFNEKNFRKINKKLIAEIAQARIQELTEIIIHNNINFVSFLKKNFPIYLVLNKKTNLKCFRDSFKFFFQKTDGLDLQFIEDHILENYYDNANQIVQYGWRREAVPIIQEKKSIITRLFELIFN